MKKNFTDDIDTGILNPAMQFISQPEEKTNNKPESSKNEEQSMNMQQMKNAEIAEGSQKTKDKEQTKKNKKLASEGYQIKPRIVERRSKQVCLLFTPSLHKKLKKISQLENRSMNDIIHTLLDEQLKNIDIE